MGDLERVIRNALAPAFPGVEVRFDPHPGYGKLHGEIIWDGFRDQQQIDRQHRVWNILRPVLTDEQRVATGFILTITRAELDAMLGAAA